MLINNIKEAPLKLLAIVTPCIGFIGFSSKLGFYLNHNVDAIWALTLFTPLDFMLSNLEVFLIYLLALTYLGNIVKGVEKLREGLISSNFILLGAFIGLSFAISYTILLNYYLYAAAGLNGFALLLFCKQYDYRALGFIILMSIPFFNGYIKGGNINTNNLPYVHLNDSVSNQKWYLLDKFSDKAILISKDESSNLFKIVELKDVKYIKNSSK